jgi:AcrR family transcriptional regulator
MPLAVRHRTNRGNLSEEAHMDMQKREHVGNRLDRRVKYTRQMLRQSLLELMAERPISRITVTALCERADVNRNTFYVHYGSPLDVLAEIENGLMREIRQSLEQLMEVDNVMAMLTEILLSIDRNRDLCRVLFSETGDAEFLSRILAMAHDRSVAAWRTAKTRLGPEQMEMLYAFFSYGSAAVIRRWVLQDTGLAAPELAAFLQQLIGLGFQSFT